MAERKTNSTLVPPKAPNLLISPPSEYEPRYHEQLNNALRLYFSQIDNFSQGVNIPSSGITGDRPNDPLLLRIGQQYYDTTLGIPIYWNGTVWKNASGTTV
jgi:hypothetical protein